jgi:NitT/TauT family transport system ATP-binding protein
MSLSAQSQPLITVAQVGKIFSNGTVALAGLDLTVEGGDFISLLGPSGCGKSTALRIIAGLSQPSSGTITWPLSVGNDHRADVGFVFQEPTLMPWETAAGNVWLPLKLRGVSRKAAMPQITEALALVGLSGFENSYPRELSGGMKMRVSIARALITQPKVILMDEPFAALDEITRQKLNDDLQQIKVQRGCTVIFVTHSVYESVYLSNRIVVMAARPGRVVREITVNAPLPRAPSFRRDPDYLDACRDASDALLGAMAAHDHL